MPPASSIRNNVKISQKKFLFDWKKVEAVEIIPQFLKTIW